MQSEENIKDYLQSTRDVPLEDLRKQLYGTKGVLMKIYDNGLSLLYCPYGSKIRSNFNREIRSIIIDNNTRELVANTGNEPYLNNEGMNYMLKDRYKNIDNYDIQVCYESYEGTLLTFYYYNNTWSVATRRCLNAKESTYNSNKSHYDLMHEVFELNQNTFEDFTNNLDKSLTYYFILIHKDAKGVIDYTSRFGENYKKLCFVGVRNKEQKLCLDYSPLFLNDNIIVPQEMSLSDINNMDELNIIDEPKVEGIILVCFDKNNKDTIIKLQTQSYQYYSISSNSMIKAYIYLYQQNKLSSVCKVNKIKYVHGYDLVELTDSVFKVCSKELFELFKILWDIKSGKQNNSGLYNLLPKEYKDILYTIRGIYNTKKSEFFEKKINLTNKDVELQQYYQESLLKSSDVYNVLKTSKVDFINSFLHARKLMKSQSVENNEYLIIFNSTSSKCLPHQIKYCEYFTDLLV